MANRIERGEKSNMKEENSINILELLKVISEEIKETRKILYGMRLYMHITSQSFVQSYRSFERNSYVHTSSTSDTAGIGFPHHYSHSYFYRVS